jgi:hypothetical protein
MGLSTAEVQMRECIIWRANSIFYKQYKNSVSSLCSKVMMIFYISLSLSTNISMVIPLDLIGRLSFGNLLLGRLSWHQ